MTSTGEIMPSLYIGGLGSLRTWTELPSNNTTVKEQDETPLTIVSVVSATFLIRVVSDLVAALKKRQSRKQINHVVWKLQDRCQSRLLSEELSEILAVMDGVQSHDQTKCLVHCVKGESRSVALCAAWLLSRRVCQSLQQAMNMIRDALPRARPNLGFVAQLKALENCNGNVTQATKRMYGDPPANEFTDETRLLMNH